MGMHRPRDAASGQAAAASGVESNATAAIGDLVPYCSMVAKRQV
jgi:hypothetical protein